MENDSLTLRLTNLEDGNEREVVLEGISAKGSVSMCDWKGNDVLHLLYNEENEDGRTTAESIAVNLTNGEWQKMDLKKGNYRREQ